MLLPRWFGSMVFQVLYPNFGTPQDARSAACPSSAPHAWAGSNAHFFLWAYYRIVLQGRAWPPGAIFVPPLGPIRERRPGRQPTTEGRDGHGARCMLAAMAAPVDPDDIELEGNGAAN